MKKSVMTLALLAASSSAFAAPGLVNVACYKHGNKLAVSVNDWDVTVLSSFRPGELVFKDQLVITEFGEAHQRVKMDHGSTLFPVSASTHYAQPAEHLVDIAIEHDKAKEGFVENVTNQGMRQEIFEKVEATRVIKTFAPNDRGYFFTFHHGAPRIFWIPKDHVVAHVYIHGWLWHPSFVALAEAEKGAFEAGLGFSARSGYDCFLVQVEGDAVEFGQGGFEQGVEQGVAQGEKLPPAKLPPAKEMPAPAPIKAVPAPAKEMPAPAPAQQQQTQQGGFQGGGQS